MTEASFFRHVRGSLIGHLTDAIEACGVPDVEYFAFERHADEVELPDKNLYGISNLTYAIDHQHMVSGQAAFALSSLPEDVLGIRWHDPMISATQAQFFPGTVLSILDMTDPAGERILGTLAITEQVVTDYARSESRTIQRVLVEFHTVDPRQQ